MIAKDAVKVHARDFIDESRPVVESAGRIAVELSKHLRAGGCVVLTVAGVRGTSSSFFNVILSGVAEALCNDFSDQRFTIETDTPTQRLVLDRSLLAFKRSA